MKALNYFWILMTMFTLTAAASLAGLPRHQPTELFLARSRSITGAYMRALMVRTVSPALAT